MGLNFGRVGVILRDPEGAASEPSEDRGSVRPLESRTQFWRVCLIFFSPEGIAIRESPDSPVKPPEDRRKLHACTGHIIVLQREPPVSLLRGETVKPLKGRTTFSVLQRAQPKSLWRENAAKSQKGRRKRNTLCRNCRPENAITREVSVGGNRKPLGGIG